MHPAHSEGIPAIKIDIHFMPVTAHAPHSNAYLHYSSIVAGAASEMYQHLH
jgi:hypothetical protein